MLGATPTILRLNRTLGTPQKKTLHHPKSLSFQAVDEVNKLKIFLVLSVFALEILLHATKNL
jgi:hypothetical protein